MTAEVYYVGNRSPNQYGAKELKKEIERNTFKGFLGTISLMILIALIALIDLGKDEMRPPLIQTGGGTIHLIDESILNQPNNTYVPPQPEPVQITGTAQVAGTPVPVPDMEVAIDKIFAGFKEMGKALANLGDTELKDVDLSKVTPDVTIDRKVIEKQSTEEVATIFEVQKVPSFDPEELSRNTIYPTLAVEAKITGLVQVEALIGKNGDVLNASIFYSENKLLNSAALEAVRNTAFTPAIQNDFPVNCKIIIPIKFRLR